VLSDVVKIDADAGRSYRRIYRQPVLGPLGLSSEGRARYAVFGGAGCK